MFHQNKLVISWVIMTRSHLVTCRPSFSHVTIRNMHFHCSTGCFMIIILLCCMPSLIFIWYGQLYWLLNCYHHCGQYLCEPPSTYSGTGPFIIPAEMMHESDKEPSPLFKSMECDSSAQSKGILEQNMIEFTSNISSMPRSCQMEALTEIDADVVILVISECLKMGDRLSIRNSWGNPRWYPWTKSKVLFLMGTHMSEAINNEVIGEVNRYADVIQIAGMEKTKDLYYRTRLHLAGLHYVTLNCKNTKYIIITKDTIFLNMFSIASSLVGSNILIPLDLNTKTSSLASIERDDVLICPVKNRNEISPLERKYLQTHSKEETSKLFDNEFCSDDLIIMKPLVACTIYNDALRTPMPEQLIFAMNSYFLTGTVAQRRGIQIHDISEHQQNRSKAQKMKWILITHQSWYSRYLKGHRMRLAWSSLIEESLPYILSASIQAGFVTQEQFEQQLEMVK